MTTCLLTWTFLSPSIIIHSSCFLHSLSHHHICTSDLPSSNICLYQLGMGVQRHRCHNNDQFLHLHRRLQTLTAFTFLLFSCASAITITRPGKAVVHTLQKIEDKGILGDSFTQGFAVKSLWERGLRDQRRLNGPGSWPPSCKSKCGWCSPCQPVHVPIQPGASTPLEYYPEAWRCKCGNNLFVP